MKTSRAGWLILFAFGVVVSYGVASSVAASRIVARHHFTDAQPSHADVGDTITVRHANGFWPCGQIGLDGGMKVKILEVGLGRRRVRILTNDAGESYLKDEQGVFPADPRIGRECWVVSEAVTR
jgi:hypothetical protein